ncbi:phenylalanyl-tRNA synthetase beta chain, partial [Streptomyces sp. PpalLS-921]
MRVNLSLLRRYRPEMPASAEDACALLEDLGIEVKRLQRSPDGDVATLELLANRGDHHCYVGIARELGGRLERPTPAPPSSEPAPEPSAAPAVETATCLAFGIGRCTLDDANPGLLPEEWRDALALNDEHTGLLAVDAANVVGREIGQPLHVYDADRVTGPLRVRLSDEGEPADLLDSDEPVPLPAGLTVVADDEGVVAVAGVMGTRRTAVTATTRRLLVESGLFDPVA